MKTRTDPVKEKQAKAAAELGCLDDYMAGFSHVDPRTWRGTSHQSYSRNEMEYRCGNGGGRLIWKSSTPDELRMRLSLRKDTCRKWSIEFVKSHPIGTTIGRGRVSALKEEQYAISMVLTLDVPDARSCPPVNHEVRA